MKEPSVILSYAYTSTYMQNHNDTIIKQTSEDFLRKICTSHFIVRVLLWERVGDRTKTAIYWPPLLWPSALCLSRFPDAQPEARGLSFLLSAGFLYHILSPTGLQNYWGPRGPLRPGVAFPTTSYQQLLWSPTHWLPVFTELYNSSTSTQSPTQSLEWHIWSSSSGNNCHAVHRSLSSGASVYECTMGFFTLSHFIS